MIPMQVSACFAPPPGLEPGMPEPKSVSSFLRWNFVNMQVRAFRAARTVREFH